LKAYIKNRDSTHWTKISKYIFMAILRSIPLSPASELYDLIAELNKSRTDIDQKIQKAFESLQETSELLKELESSLKERTEKVNFLRHECDRYSKLAELEEDKAKVIIEQLELSLGKGRNRERWASLLISLIAGLIVFVLGIWFGPHLTKLLGLSK